MFIRLLFSAIAAFSVIAAAGCSNGASTFSPGAAHVAAGHGPAAHRKSQLGLLPGPNGPCPDEAIFVRLPGEIRGYPLSASGPASPCTDILGDQTLLTGNGDGFGAMAVSVHGNLHALAFQSNASGGLLIFSPDATGNATPLRAIAVDQDHVALAIDSQVNDYVVASQAYSVDSCWYVVPSNALASTTSNCDANVSAIYALAITPKDELVVLGADATTSATRIDVFANAASATPTLVHAITGAATGLPLVNSDYFSNSYSLATDPVAGTIYVLSAGAGGLTAPKVSEFAADANGNVPPLNVLSGPLTQLPGSAFAINVMTVDCSANLYVNSTGVARPDVLISVFAPNAAGNTAPVSTIEDDTLLNPGSGGIAARTCVNDVDGGTTIQPVRVREKAAGFRQHPKTPA